MANFNEPRVLLSEPDNLTIPTSNGEPCPESILRSMPRRLGKVLRDATGLSRRALGRLHHQHEISLARHGSGVSSPESLAMLIFEDDEIFLSGEPLRLDNPCAQQSFLLNKPKGIVTTTKDPGGKPDLQPWLEQLPDEVFPVGRLDRETSGLLLLTTDGDLAHMLLKPDFHIPKCYHLTLRHRPKTLKRGALQLLEGIELDDGPARALSLSLSATQPAHELTTVRMVIDQGRNRQVRRMCRAVGWELVHLHRLAIGPLRLRGLRAGQLQPLESDQVNTLWSCVGGRHLPTLRAIYALERLAQHAHLQGQPEPRLDAWLAREDVRRWIARFPTP